ncbi:MAG: chorismate mutase, partial [Candidatus Altiarchaeota archaeon]|nr:chorismate mutase [Candidatus Altiarchaeota archaeon]
MKSKVAVLGPKGTFTEIAARRVFPEGDFIYCDTVDEVFDRVDSGMDFGVVAIENSLEGSVNVTMDCLLDYDVRIWKELVMDITLCLAAPPGTKMEDVEVIAS